ncbi:unnamed protein product [Prorocentrum cordatum]|uniref:STAS/SEC14 domain-containing protein n=1 Tax=Prorocentrum cordatum TaxID=2364126 RepID=A0ABN9UEG5_9DINO|nr:unnamed protein product [Polarella glacialis]
MQFWDDGLIVAEVSGFGTAPLLDALGAGVAEAMVRVPEVECRGLADMRHGVGSTPGCVASMVSFLKEHGARISRAAIVAPWPLAGLARLAVRMADQQGVQFFGDRESAQQWLSQFGRPP